MLKVSSQSCLCVFSSFFRLLGDMVMHFHASQEEVTLSMSAPKVSLRNYNEGRNGQLMSDCHLAQPTCG